MNKLIKNMSIEYYKTYSFVDREKKLEERPVDISDFLEKLSKTDINKRIMPYNGEKLILKSIKLNNNNLWELLFLKTTNNKIPYIINDYGDSVKDIELDKNENIAQEICILYDANKKIVVVQRNVYAVGIRGIEDFLNLYMVQYPIKFVSINRLGNDKIIDHSLMKKLSIIVHNPKKNDKSKDEQISKINFKNSNLSRILQNSMETGCSVLNLDLSMGNVKDLLKLQKEDIEMFQELIGNKDVKKLEIGTVPDEKASMQITDFVNIREKDIISVSIEEKKSIDINNIFKHMTNKYKSRENL
jgi:hypothetical protein